MWGKYSGHVPDGYVILADGRCDKEVVEREQIHVLADSGCDDSDQSPGCMKLQ
jgi:hypothetical protein